MANSNHYEDTLKNVKGQKSGNVLFDFSKTYPAYLILIFAIGLSYFLMTYLDEQLKDETNELFDEAVGSVVSRVEGSLLTNQSIIQSVEAVFEREYLVRDIFEINTTNPLKTYSYINMFGIAQRVEQTYKSVDNYIYRVRSQYYEENPDFSGIPKTGDYFYLYNTISPVDKYLNRFGMDIGADTVVKNVIETSAISGERIMTPIHYNISNELVYYMVSPVYKYGKESKTREQRRKNFSQCLLMEVNAEEFFRNSIGLGIATDSTIIFEIMDDDHSGEQHQVFTSFNYEKFKGQQNPLKSSVRDVEFANHTIHIKFETIPGFISDFQRNLPIIAFSGGILLSLILFGFIISVITSRQRALDLAERMTRSQRRIVDSSQDIIAVLDFNGNWQTMNPASEKIFKVLPDELIGSKIDDLFLVKEDQSIFYDLVASDLDEHTEKVDVRMKDAAGELKWINWSFTISKSDNLIYAIGRNVTLEKEAEEQQLIASKQVHLAERFSREASESKSVFMTKLSHQLRNSLTGILGYMQLLENGIYDTEDEMKTYVQLAEQSSEEIYQFVTDILDLTTDNDSDNSLPLDSYNLYETYEIAAWKFHFSPDLPDVHIELAEESKNVKYYGNKYVVSEILLLSFAVLAANQNKKTINISATENPYENALEIQLVGEINPLFEEKLRVYKENKNEIVDSIEEDEEDILLNLAIIESDIRRINGSVTIESFGGEDGNIIMMNVPLSQS